MSEDQENALNFKDSRLKGPDGTLNSRAQEEQAALIAARGKPRAKEGVKVAVSEPEKPFQDVLADLNQKALELTKRLGPSGHVEVESGVVLRIPGESPVVEGNSYITVSDRRQREQRSFSVVMSPDASEPNERLQILDYDHTKDGSHNWREISQVQTKGELYETQPDVASYDRYLDRALEQTSQSSK